MRRRKLANFDSSNRCHPKFFCSPIRHSVGWVIRRSICMSLRMPLAARYKSTKRQSIHAATVSRSSQFTCACIPRVLCHSHCVDVSIPSEFRLHLRLQLYLHMLKRMNTIKVACLACYSIIMIAG